MILVFPVSHVDLHIALPLAKWLRKLGPYPRHEALLCWSSELTPEQREPIAVEFRQMGWKEPAKAFTAQVTEQSWPEAPNQIFRQCANIIEADPQLRKVWYFFEADNVPLKAGWMDALADEYNQDLSRPFLGYIDTTWERMDSTGQLNKIGNHLSGTALYPPMISQHTHNHLDCLNAFDLAIAQDVVPKARHTKLIHNNWNSFNYRWESRDGKRQLVSDIRNLRAQQFGEAINRPVSEEALVVHGCKDTSLLDLLQAPEKVAEVVIPEAVVIPELPPEPDPKVNKRLKILTPEQEEELQQLLNGQQGVVTVEAEKPRRKYGRSMMKTARRKKT
jgi:hypothetical protein